MNENKIDWRNGGEREREREIVREREIERERERVKLVEELHWTNFGCVTEDVILVSLSYPRFFLQTRYNI